MKSLVVKKGDRYGRLTILKEIDERGRERRFSVKCECGLVKECDLAQMRKGKTVSCGCFGKEKRRIGTTTHGHGSRMKRTKTYMTWASMIARCTNPNEKSYQRYGGRGINVSDKWHDFEGFLNDMGEKPKDLSIDRIDNSKGYSKENCRWADKYQQAKNRKNTHWITYEGKTMTARDWAKEKGINEDTLYSRLKVGTKLPELLYKNLKKKS